MGQDSVNGGGDFLIQDSPQTAEQPVEDYSQQYVDEYGVGGGANGNSMNVMDKYEVERSDIANINKRIDLLKQSIQSSSDDDMMRQFKAKIAGQGDSVNQTTVVHYGQSGNRTHSTD